MGDFDQRLAALALSLALQAGDPEFGDDEVGEGAGDGDGLALGHERADAGDGALARGGRQDRDRAAALGEERADLEVELATDAGVLDRPEGFGVDLAGEV